MDMPTDIKQQILKMFPDLEDQKAIQKILLPLFHASFNVGSEQLVRSILVLSEGDVRKAEEIVAENFFGDPRDVVQMAENKAGHPGHYFNCPF